MDDTYSWDNKLSSKETHCWERTVGHESNGSEWVYNGVDISKSLKAFELSSITIPKWTMTTKKDFNRTKSPS